MIPTWTFTEVRRLRMEMFSENLQNHRGSKQKVTPVGQNRTCSCHVSPGHVSLDGGGQVGLSLVVQERQELANLFLTNAGERGALHLCIQSEQIPSIRMCEILFCDQQARDAHQEEKLYQNYRWDVKRDHRTGKVLEERRGQSNYL